MGNALFWLHQAAKSLFVFGTALIAALLLTGGAVRRQRLMAHRAATGQIAVHFLLVLALIPVILTLPRGPVPDLSAAELLRYAVSTLLLAGVVATAIGLVISVGLLRHRPLHILAGGVVAVFALAPHFLNTLMNKSAAVQVVQVAMQDATLWLMIRLYTITGADAPAITWSGVGNPILSEAGFAIEMAPSCAGYQGVLSGLALLSGYVLLERRRLHMPRALPLVLLAAVAVFLMNGARLALLMHLGVAGHAEMAVNGFHSHFGIISLLLVVGLAVLLLERVAVGRAWVKDAPPETASGVVVALAPALLPLALVMGVSFLTGAVSGAFPWLYPLHAGIGLALIIARWRQVRVWLGQIDSALPVWVGLLVYALWVWMIPVDPARNQIFGDALSGAMPLVAVVWLVARVLGASIVIPVLEELAFRGGVQQAVAALVPGSVLAMLRAATGVAFGALTFALLHQDILPALLAGLAYGVAFARRGRLGEAILAHVTTNFMLAIHVLALGEWSYW